MGTIRLSLLVMKDKTSGPFLQNSLLKYMEWENGQHLFRVYHDKALCQTLQDSLWTLLEYLQLLCQIPIPAVLLFSQYGFLTRKMYTMETKQNC